ncbi:hypothetical protein B0H66DRAFT_617150 [Apodospora peruviana]|uniref:Zn(2)-C6 fungal-type domain-containing protein n=1 Tax=Apodospora peruviana TaxID=516989 RepID=A0AAE0IKV7_9PEZI|nr:hypothetical protein B0H66DRAFT_617150 [Apodospora peruviana]
MATTAVKRACDACHRRKVKCDGINPCRNCSASQLGCTYNAIPQKKGPKGSRAKVISELRENQRQTSLSAKVQNRINGINSPPSSPNHAPNPGLLSSEMVKESIEFFFANMYPSMPILQRQRLEQQSLHMDQNLDTYCLLTSLSSFMMLQPGMVMPGGDPYSFDSMAGANIVSSTLLLEETLRVRKGFDYMDSPSLNTLCTSYFLFGIFYGLDIHEKAWFHLREATTLMLMMGMNKESTYQQHYDRIEASRRRRLYWLLFVTERAYALKLNRPLTLDASIDLPSLNDDPTDLNPHQLNEFVHQINLFRSFDNVLVPLWNKTKERDEASPYLQKQLSDVLPPYLNAQNAQLAELQINQHWAKNTLWQLSVASGNEGESGVPYPYPVDITRDLLPLANALPGNLGFNGLTLVEKLLSVTCSLTEFLGMQPASRDPYSMGPREYLHQILNVLTVIRGGDLRFLPLLLNKVHNAVLRLANPMLQNAPENAAPIIDIFDGFGTAGMAQPPVFSTDDYDNKYGIQRVDDMDSGSSNGTTMSNSELSSPFDSNPSIMSPGVDISHGLSEGFSSMPDIVMSPLSHAPPTSLSTPGPMSNQQPQHASMPPFPGLGAQMQGLNTGNINPPPNIGLPAQMHLSQGMGMNNGLGQSLNANNMMSRPPPPQRTSSFALGPPIRTVGDFHALQRANSDMGSMNSLGLSPMGTELDFNTIPNTLPR